MKSREVNKPVGALEGPACKPQHASVLARAPTRKWFPHLGVHEYLQTIFDTNVFKTHQHAVYQYLNKPPTREHL